MKLDNLIEGYRFNRIKANIKEKNNDYTGVINYTPNINSSYMLDDEGYISVLIIFSVTNIKTKIEEQLRHSEDTLIIIQKSIELLSNLNQAEANEVMKQLGMFNGLKNKKSVTVNGYTFEIDVINGILKFTIISNADLKTEEAPR